MSRVEELNQYIQELFDYWDGKNDDFEPIPIPKEVDDEQRYSEEQDVIDRETKKFLWTRMENLYSARLKDRKQKL